MGTGRWKVVPIIEPLERRRLLSVGVVTTFPSSVDSRYAVAVGDTLFFANPEIPATSYWRFDGTTAGAVQIGDPSNPSTPLETLNPGKLAPLGDKLLIDTGYQNLFVIDAHADQAVSIPVTVSHELYNHTPNGIVMGGFYYFVRQADHSSAGVTYGSDQLWRTDGTAAGTSLVKELETQFNVSDNGFYAGINQLTAVGNRLYFDGYTQGSGGEPWTSDGSPDGTHLLIDLATGPESSGVGRSSDPSNFTPVGNRVVFFAYAGSGEDGTRVWSTDGTAKGTVLLAKSSTIEIPIASPGQKLAYFNASSKVWRTDGTKAGTFSIAGGSTIGDFENRFYFGDGAQTYFTTDGTAAGIHKGNPPFDLGFSSFAWPVALGDRFVFQASNSNVDQVSAYATDGTAAGTRQLTDPGQINGIVPASSRAFLIGSPDSNDDRRNLYLYDPTAGSIAGTVFDDANGNGARDAGEAALKGYKVFIDRNGDGVCNKNEISTRATSTGRYRFDLLPAGTYTIRIVGAAGKRASTPEQYRLKVRGDQSVTRYFGRSSNILLAGLVYHDANQNGTIDNGEAGIPGWTVFIDADGDGTRDDTEPAIVTDDLGKFTFGSLPAGTYVLRVVPQSSHQLTSPGAGYRRATLATAQVNAKLNFGEGPLN